MDHLERVKLPGQAWNTMEESGNGGSRSFVLAGVDASEAVLSDVLDTRGAGAIGMEVNLTKIDQTDVLIVLALTRSLGLPWHSVPITVQTNTPPNITWDIEAFFQAFPSSGGVFAIPAIRRIGLVGLLDETIVIAQPAFNSTKAELIVDSLTIDAFEAGEWGNSLKLAYLDPGVPDSQLAVASSDGWTTEVLLETDNMGAIVTQPGDVDNLLNPSTDGTVFAIQISDSVDTNPVTAMAATPFVGGAGGPNGPQTFTITGTY